MTGRKALHLQRRTVTSGSFFREDHACLRIVLARPLAI
jgi:hypothetical protein